MLLHKRLILVTILWDWAANLENNSLLTTTCFEKSQWEKLLAISAGWIKGASCKPGAWKRLKKRQKCSTSFGDLSYTATFYKGCWFLQLINTDLGTPFPLACSQPSGLAGSGQCCTAALHSCNKQKLQETFPFLQKKPAQDLYNESHGRHKNISSAPLWNLGVVLCNCELHILVACLGTIYISETPSIPWHGPSQLQSPLRDGKGGENCAVPAFTQPASPASLCLWASLTCEGIKKKPEAPRLFLFMIVSMGHSLSRLLVLVSEAVLESEIPFIYRGNKSPGLNSS